MEGKRGVAMITSRMKKIIRILLESDDYITVSKIAAELDVSTRTVLRELDDVQQWIVKHGGDLDKKKGKGIRFLGNGTERDDFLALLSETKSEVIYTPEDRKTIIKAKLLQYDEPTKLYSLTRLLNVTESTVGSDLDSLIGWFGNFHLQVVKRPGMGIVIKGSEKGKRKAIVSLIYDHFHMNELINVMSSRKAMDLGTTSLESRINSAILELLDVGNVDRIRELIEAIETEMGYEYADNGYIALAIRIGVTLKRKAFWGDIELNDNVVKKLYNDRVFKTLMQYLENHPDHPLNALPHVELCYLTMHVKGTKLRETKDYNKISMIEDFKVLQLVKEFIAKAEAETGIYLTDNEQLVIDLVKHLRPSIFRMKMDLDIVNPLVEEIKAMYPKLFQSIKRSVRVIEEKENITVPDDEVAYLATHIGAIIHRSNRDMKKTFKAVVACMYGIGASAFLMAQLKKKLS